jgi:hypothetical protein
MQRLIDRWLPVGGLERAAGALGGRLVREFTRAQQGRLAIA